MKAISRVHQNQRQKHLPEEFDGAQEEARFTKWKEWLEKIGQQATDLFVLQHIYKTVGKMVRTNPRLRKAQSHFFWWMGYTYGTAMLVGLRRLVDKDERTVSLYRLLDDIRQYPHILSRNRFIQSVKPQPIIPVSSAAQDVVLEAEQWLYDEDLKKANRRFDDLCGQGKLYIDPKDVESDLQQLEQKLATLKNFTNKRIAHYDGSNPPGKVPTFENLDDSLNLIEKLLDKYSELMHTPVPNRSIRWTYDWTAIFDFPWKENLLPPQQKRLSELLQKNAMNRLTPEEEAELDKFIEEADDLAIEKAKLELTEG